MQIAFGVDEMLKDYRDNFKANKWDYQKVRRGCLQRGVRLHPSRGRLYTSAAHTEEDVDETLEVMEAVFSEIFKK